VSPTRGLGGERFTVSSSLTPLSPTTRGGFEGLPFAWVSSKAASRTGSAAASRPLWGGSTSSPAAAVVAQPGNTRGTASTSPSGTRAAPTAIGSPPAIRRPDVRVTAACSSGSSHPLSPPAAAVGSTVGGEGVHSLHLSWAEGGDAGSASPRVGAVSPIKPAAAARSRLSPSSAAASAAAPLKPPWHLLGSGNAVPWASQAGVVSGNRLPQSGASAQRLSPAPPSAAGTLTTGPGPGFLVPAGQLRLCPTPPPGAPQTASGGPTGGRRPLRRRHSSPSLAAAAEQALALVSPSELPVLKEAVDDIVGTATASEATTQETSPESSPSSAPQWRLHAGRSAVGAGEDQDSRLHGFCSMGGA